jgi:hypothetical protein
MQAAFLRANGYPEYADVLVPKIIRGEIGQWLTPTQIAERCGKDMSARNINYFLMNKGFQYQDGGLWRLTPDKGTSYGEEYIFESPQKHREIRIRWNFSVIAASGLLKDQMSD